MAIEKLYHVCNLGQRVVFRNEDDYVMAINRLASCAFATASEIWAYAIMSTHFHIIVRTARIAELMNMYKRGIAIWHNKKYCASISLDVSHRLLSNPREIITALNYVLKNPLHHNVCELPFKYPYSSVNCYFKQEMEREEYFAGEKSSAPDIKPSQCANRKYRKCFGSSIVPDDYSLIGGVMVRPESFVAVPNVRSLYKSSRNFIYNMNSALKEEEDMFSDGKPNSVSLFGRISDRNLCAQIDSTIAPKTYTQLSSLEMEEMWYKYSREGVDKYQFARIMGVVFK